MCKYILLTKAIISWRRHNDDVDTHRELERSFPLPHINAHHIPVVVSIEVPPMVYCGEQFTLKVLLVNQTDQIQVLRVVR